MVKIDFFLKNLENTIFIEDPYMSSVHDKDKEERRQKHEAVLIYLSYFELHSLEVKSFLYMQEVIASV